MEGVIKMLKKPERGSRNVNDLFYEAKGRRIQKMNEVLAGVELTKSEESIVDNLLSVIEKAARIRADKKGGYSHQFKVETER